MATLFAASVSMRAYFSAYHLWAAKRFAKLADATEDDAEGFNIGNRAFVTSAVLSAAAFLEAAINEIYDDVVDGYTLRRRPSRKYQSMSDSPVDS
jgi:hypothetical protein